MAEEACRVRNAIARKLVLQGSVSIEEGLTMMDGEYDYFFAWHMFELPIEREMTHYKEWGVYGHLVGFHPYTKEDKERMMAEDPDNFPALLEETYGYDSWFSVDSVCRLSDEDFMVKEDEHAFSKYTLRFMKRNKVLSVPSVMKRLLEETTTQGK